MKELLLDLKVAEKKLDNTIKYLRPKKHLGLAVQGAKRFVNVYYKDQQEAQLVVEYALAQIKQTIAHIVLTQAQREKEYSDAICGYYKKHLEHLRGAK